MKYILIGIMIGLFNGCVEKELKPITIQRPILPVYDYNDSDFNLTYEIVEEGY